MPAAAALRPVRRALVSVSDKTRIADFARALSQRNVEILSTGGTARLLASVDIPVVDVADYTGFPAIMDGRVKTLHPKVHGGLLARRGTDEGIMAEHGIEPIDLLVVNLYPFEAVIANRDCSLAEAIENIDIGGPAMVRAAAKNHDGVGVLTDVADYPAVLAALDEEGGLPAALRFRLAVKAFAYTAGYDRAIAEYLARRSESDTLPERLDLPLEKVQELRYGENPHQKAALYRDPSFAGCAVATAKQLQGKPLSYNNIADADAALECVRGFDRPACVIVKHANPCGVAIGASLLEAYERAYRTDPTSAFGGIIAFNAALDAATARAMIARQFVEVVIAPAVGREALAVIGERKSLRLLCCGYWTDALDDGLDVKRVRGGLLVQQADGLLLPPDGDLEVVTPRCPSAAAMRDLRFVWRVAKAVKSNAIVYGRDGATLGIGAGQMSRVDSALIGARKAADAGLSLHGAALASDAFFPFRDGVDQAAAVGVTAIVQPGGSIRDEEIIAAADEHGIAMVFTHMRHFRH